MVKDMTIYIISDFTDAPHWDVAFIEAESPQDAAAKLLTILRDENQRPDTVWGYDEPEPFVDPAKWRVAEAARPLRFVLGGGCR